MKIEQSGTEQLTIEISVDELVIVNNALNEVCNLHSTHAFQTRMGGTLDEAMDLLARISDAIDASGKLRH